ncbi:MAG TPA: hypothetical protein VHL78_10580, partial [Actinomycetota bacterium]|nr:hypothetical protein [Actinomycetota bacterium]
DPSDNLQAANFNLTDDATPGLPQQVFGNLLPGTYTVEEVNLPAGWQLTDLDCTGASQSTVRIVGAEISIDLAAGEQVTCSFEDTQQGSLTIQKDSIPDSNQPFEFDPSANLQAANFTLTDDAAPGLPSQDFIGLPPGTYTVEEVNLPAGWELTDVACSGANSSVVTITGAQISVDLAAGEAIVCKFENTQEGSITIEKDAVPDSSQPFEFDPSANLQPNNFFLTDDATPGLAQETFTGLLSGTYTVEEVNLPAGWQLTDLACAGGGADTTTAGALATIGLDPGEAVVCTFTDTQQASLTIVKDALPDSEQDFEFLPSDNLGAAFLLDDDGDPTLSSSRAFRGLTPGTYRVSEQPPPDGWNLDTVTCAGGAEITIDGATVTVRLAAGEDVTCTFLNVQTLGEERGSITIVKDALPDSEQDFEFLPSDNLGAAFLLDDDGDETLSDTQSFINLVAGAYTVTEQLPPDGWSLDSITCEGDAATSVEGATVAIELGAGETTTCTFLNTQVQPGDQGVITIIKDAVPDTEQEFSYEGDLGTFALTDDGSGRDNEASFGGLAAGAYRVSEIVPDGWTVDSISCDDPSGGTAADVATGAVTVDLAPEERVVCTFTNVGAAAIPRGKQPPTSLPVTGAGIFGLLAVALALLAGSGALHLAGTRRRRDDGLALTTDADRQALDERLAEAAVDPTPPAPSAGTGRWTPGRRTALAIGAGAAAAALVWYVARKRSR